MTQLNNLFTLIKNESLTSRIIMLILLLYPALLLTVKGSMGVMFFLLLVTSSVYLYRTRTTRTSPLWDDYSMAFAIAMASPVIAIFLSQAYHGEFRAQPYDWASRFLLAVPIFLALRQMNIRVLAVIQYGFPLGGLVAFITLLINNYEPEVHRFTSAPHINLIHFSDLALMLGFISLISIHWTRRDHFAIQGFKILGALAGFYMSVQTDQRGSLLTIPVFAIIYVALFHRKHLWSRLVLAFVALTIILAVSYTLRPVLKTKIEQVSQEITMYSLGNKDTSVGIRLQQWHAALYVFIENPLFGIGPNGFSKEADELKKKGLLTNLGLELSHGEMHSEIFKKGAELGVIGLISLAYIYFIPLAIFRRVNKTSATPEVRSACFMGSGLVLGFLIFGLTAEVFNLKMTAAFFALTLAVIMAAATNKHQS